MDINDLTIAATDVETTGFDYLEDRIIEIGFVTMKGGELMDAWGTLVDPERTIPEKVTEITGITDADVAGKPLFKSVADRAHDTISSADLVLAYNADFDYNFIRTGLKRHGFDWPREAHIIDPLIFARKLYATKQSRALGKVCEYLGITLDEAHRAESDAEAAARVLYRLLEEFPEHLPTDLSQLLQLQSQWKRSQEGNPFYRSGDMPTRVHDQAGTSALGAAYLFGDELDPLRAIYANAPALPPNSVRLDWSWQSKGGKRGRSKGKSKGKGRRVGITRRRSKKRRG